MTLDYKILGQLYYGPEINETPEIPGTSGYYTSVTGGIENRFVTASGYGDKTLYSSDGVTWTQGSITFGQWRLVYGDNKFIAINSGYSNYGYSLDGISWTYYELPTSAQWAQPIYADGKFVTVSAENNVGIYSTDGLSWTTFSLPSGTYFSLEYGNGSFVVGGIDKILHSTNLINWMEVSLQNTWQKIIYGNGTFVACSFFGLKYSTNGVNWYDTSGGNTTAAGFNNITGIYAAGKFIVTGSSLDYTAVSQDGISWNMYQKPNNNTSTVEIVYGGAIFVARFGQNIYYSTDGLDWTLSEATEVFGTGFAFGEVNTLVEVQISIGGQGTPGSYVEIVEPQVLYTVPAGTETTVTSIYVTNHDLIQRTYDLAVVPQGETLSLKHHIRWDMPVSGSDFDLSNAKLTLSAGDKIYVFPSTINKIGFTAFGVEKS